ncbi:MAG: regulatory protein RecX [Candidatus Microbacterium colombiense]|nr:MAG: regulatory protein RecX [Microbacterium sp.]
MTGENGGESNGHTGRLAPIIPLFGGKASRPEPSVDDASRSQTPTESAAERAESVVPRRTGDSGLWRSTWDGPVDSVPHAESGAERLPSDRHPAHGKTSQTAPPRLTVLPPTEIDRSEDIDDGLDQDTERQIATDALVRKLRSRSLSVSEARTVLRGHAISAQQVDDVLDECSRRGYLDDARLAAQLVESGSQRKGQGRVALSRALAQRGLPRDVVDAALDELPDDDAERALDFARTKARSLSKLDGDTALRRLVGQLSRRGYNGAIAMNAAKVALAEASFGGRSIGVRFVDSD